MASLFGGIGAVAGFLAVALGAFGAHALKDRLPAGDLVIFETAVRYQMYHALALLLLAALLIRSPSASGILSGWGFSLGILVFSGSLYLMLFTGHRWLGAVTPIGGVAFLVGWLALAWHMFRSIP